MKLPLWATLFTALGVLILCSLGTWQLQRLAWKTDILEGLDAAYENPQDILTHDSLETRDFAYGQITGIFTWDKAFLSGYKVKDGAAGQDLILPLKTPQGDVLINLGFNHETHALDNHLLSNFDAQSITITGLAREADWNSFTPENKPDEGLWYRLNIPEIAAHFSLENPAPFIVFAHEASPALGDHFPNHERWTPNNNHLQYAAFWFTMALTLIAVFVFRFIRK